MAAIPDTMTAWPLFGAGMQSLGKDDKPCVVPVPQVGDDELLVKIDAIGLCFSDIKLIKAGLTHPRVISKDLANDPVIPGHEAVMTVVKVGRALQGSFTPGRRYIIQADIYVKGKGLAYGYAINGGMALYSIIDQRVLNGDEGCYLLPLADSIPAALAALVEPWTCVIASYRIQNRSKPLPQGNILVAGNPGDSASYTPGTLLVDAGPASITFLGVPDDKISAFVGNFRNSPKIITAASLEQLGGKAFDDVFMCGVSDAKTSNALCKLCARNAVISFVGAYPKEALPFDIGNIHYEGWFYQGTASHDLSSAYGRNVRSTLKKGGTCWLVGGAGAMGQMHTQLAVESEDGPARILVTDMDDTRLQKVTTLLSPSVKRKGLEFKAFNPKSFATPADFLKAVRGFSPDGFDDIIMLVPVIEVFESALPFMKKDCVMNIFAGIPAVKQGKISPEGIAEKGHRFIGSSGSRTADLRHTLELVESGRLNPATALAAVGGMNDLKKGLEAVANATYAGKTVIFPHCPNLPLTPIEKLDEVIPDAVKTFDNEGFYSKKTEEAILGKFS